MRRHGQYVNWMQAMGSVYLQAKEFLCNARWTKRTAMQPSYWVSLNSLHYWALLPLRFHWELHTANCKPFTTKLDTDTWNYIPHNTPCLIKLKFHYADFHRNFPAELHTVDTNHESRRHNLSQSRRNEFGLKKRTTFYRSRKQRAFAE